MKKRSIKRRLRLVPDPEGASPRPLGGRSTAKGIRASQGFVASTGYHQENSNPCAGCESMCCSAVGSPSVRREDVRRLAEHFGLSFHEAFDKFVDDNHEELAPGFAGSLKRGTKEDAYGRPYCMFFNESAPKGFNCGIHQARPRVCNTWQATECPVRDVKEENDYGPLARDGRSVAEINAALEDLGFI